MSIISRNTLGTSVLFLLLTLVPLAQAQDLGLPQDLTAVSVTDAMALNFGRLYRFSSWPNDPPLPPLVLLADPAIGEDGSGSTTNLFYSASLAALFWDDRESAALQALAQAAMNGNRQMSQQEQEDEQEGYDLPTLDTTGLYLEITNVANGLAYCNLWNGTNQVYAIWAAPNPLGPWTVGTEVWPTNGEVAPFTLASSGQDALFAFAQDWTGVTENGNSVPDWWLWKYFGTVALSDTSLDSQGNTLLYDYTNGYDPNVITFRVSATNSYVNQTTVQMQVSLLAGVPSYYAVLVNDTNLADANWLAYPGTRLAVNLGSTAGVYTVCIGLRGLPPTATQSWQSLTFYCDTTPLTLAFTNLAGMSGSRPFIDPAGYASRALRALSWTVRGANGGTNTGSGAVVAQGRNRSDQYHATNWFQCVDLALALGTNWISIQAADRAGTVTVTNFFYVFDTNGDTTAPALTLVWPQDGTLVSGDNFAVQAWMDDDTGTAALQYTDGDGIVQTVTGLVERGGNVWVENVPLIAGTNRLSLMASDAAGNVSTNSFSVVQSNVGLTVTPLSQDEMKGAYANVYGTVDDPVCAVTVNGFPGINYGGYWEVDNVPLPPGGTVTLQVTAQMADGSAPQNLLEQDRQPVVFTQTFDYNLDYHLFVDWPESTNHWFTTHTAFPWVRGAESTYTHTHSEYNPSTGNVGTEEIVTTWPADNGYVPSLPGQRVVSVYVNGQLWQTFTQSASAPVAAVETMEKSTSAGTWRENYNTTWSESSDREVRLFTGGKALRRSQGLFDLSAGLTYADCLDWEVLGWGVSYESGNFLWYDDPPVAVPSGDITLGALGPLGSDGHLWTVQPDGIEIIITPQVLSCRSASAASASPNVATATDGSLPAAPKYRLNITANSQDCEPEISPVTPKFFVGQLVTFSSYWDGTGSPPGLDHTTNLWTLAGHYYNDGTNSVPGVSWPTCSSNYFVNQAMLTNDPTTGPAWWVSGGIDSPDPYPVIFDMGLFFTNGQYLSVHKEGKINMCKPRASISTQTTSVSVVGSRLMFAESLAVEGIVFTPSIQTGGFGGTGSWQQVDSSPIRVIQDASGTNHTLVQPAPGPWLDWDPRSPVPDEIPMQPPSACAKDSPFIEGRSSDIRIEAADTFTMWLMYRPPGGMRVPLRAVNWSWWGFATNGPSGWALGNGTNSINPTDYSTETYPSWKSKVNKDNTNYVPPL
ncbi:MAG: hypothetical protein WCK27_12530 [Verrucomicrobiota bacterium]